MMIPELIEEKNTVMSFYHSFIDIANNKLGFVTQNEHEPIFYLDYFIHYILYSKIKVPYFLACNKYYLYTDEVTPVKIVYHEKHNEKSAIALTKKSYSRINSYMEPLYTSLIFVEKNKKNKKVNVRQEYLEIRSLEELKDNPVFMEKFSNRNEYYLINKVTLFFPQKSKGTLINLLGTIYRYIMPDKILDIFEDKLESLRCNFDENIHILIDIDNNQKINIFNFPDIYQRFHFVSFITHATLQLVF